MRRQWVTVDVFGLRRLAEARAREIAQQRPDVTARAHRAGRVWLVQVLVALAALLAGCGPAGAAA